MDWSRVAILVGAIAIVALTCGRPAVAGDELVTPKQRAHWAYQRLGNPSPPAATSSRIRTPIDAFLSARLERAGLRLSPDADRRTLIRRLSLDLLGLLPTRGEISAFLSDREPGAYSRLVERLLASPHFGERWGRHWLDVTGHSDVWGSDNDPTVGGGVRKVAPGKWRYRDYVIDAFNSDLPFERFLLEQMAGDELVEWRSAESFDERQLRLLVATGFVRSAPDDTDENELNTLDIRYATLHRTGEMIANNLLATTVQCAKCHDHKYEAVPQRDYYRLMSFFQPALNPASWIQPQKRRLTKKGVTVHALYDVGAPPETRRLHRGEFFSPRDVIAPGFLAVLSESEKESLYVDRKPVNGSSGRRTALARWLTNWKQRSGALVARVRMNRVWQRLFGRGIVESSGNFGVSGEAPSHPELLEWLARDFVDGGGELKPVIRRIVHSTVYRQSSAQTKEVGIARRVDPRNLLLWRMPIKRLEAEIIRDSVLCASEALDQQMGGPSLGLKLLPDGRFVIEKEKLPRPGAQHRRSVYVLARRNYHLSFFEVFDQPQLTESCGQRESSSVVLQSLSMLNDVFVLEHAKAIASRVCEAGRDVEAVRSSFESVLCRPPGSEEGAWALRFIEEQRTDYANRKLSTEAARKSAFADLARMLLNTSEFLYVP
ncbi:MAG: DUF1549 and DUF1553 domain-containing protein [Planctomycetota bacterium]